MIWHVRGLAVSMEVPRRRLGQQETVLGAVWTQDERLDGVYIQKDCSGVNDRQRKSSLWEFATSAHLLTVT